MSLLLRFCQICLNADQLLMELQNSQARISYYYDLRSTAIPSGGVINKCRFSHFFGGVVYFLPLEPASSLTKLQFPVYIHHPNNVCGQ